MSAASQIPNPAHTLAESMLSRRFGKETVNYFSSTWQTAVTGAFSRQTGLIVHRLSNQSIVVLAK
jgi:hypothetical protein